MKCAVSLFCLCLFMSQGYAYNSNDSVCIKGVVRPENTRYPFKILKHVSVSLLKNDQTIGKTFSDDSGKFQLRCALKDVKASLQLLLEARSGQPVITYDSICPYLINKTSDRYFDRYVNLNTKMLHNNEVFIEVLMSAPLLYTNHCMAFNLDDSCVTNLPCLSKNKDTMCICIGNSYKRLRLIDQNIVPTVWVRSYYTDHADSAKMRAEKVMDLLKNYVDIDIKYVKIVPVSWSENDKFEDPYTPRFNYVVVNIMLERITREKDH